MTAGQACKLMRFSLIGMLITFFVGVIFGDVGVIVALCVLFGLGCIVCFIIARFSWRCGHCGFLLPARGTWLWITHCPCCGEALEDMGE